LCLGFEIWKDWAVTTKSINQPVTGVSYEKQGAENHHRNAAFQIKRFLLNIMFQTRFPLKYG
jgi:hypothetical protein